MASVQARCAQRALRNLNRAASTRCYSSTTQQTSSPVPPRHLMSMADLTNSEVTALVRNAAAVKKALKSGSTPRHLQGALAGKNIAMSFSKRSTRTRVSCESATVALGGHPMFLGAQDIQLGVNESLRDTAVIISSMTAGIFARVGPHSDVLGLAKWSSVPVINCLSDMHHPLQTIADLLTIHEAFAGEGDAGTKDDLGLSGLKIAWIGDCNNVLFDLAIGAAKVGIDVAVASPPGYDVIPAEVRLKLIEARVLSPHSCQLTQTTAPEEAIRNADILVTDTWISMGQEAEKTERLRAFEGYQVTNELAKRGCAKPGWKFMHCLPRHQEEVDDEVFYGDRSLVFQEGENRLWAAMSALEGFVVNKGKIV